MVQRLAILISLISTTQCCPDAEKEYSVKQTLEMVKCLEKDLFFIADLADDVKVCCEASAKDQYWPPFSEIMGLCLMEKWDKAIKSCKVNDWDQARFIRCNVDKNFIQKLKLIDISCSKGFNKEYPKAKEGCTDWFKKYKACVQIIGGQVLKQLGDTSLSSDCKVKDLIQPFCNFIDGKKIEDTLKIIEI